MALLVGAVALTLIVTGLPRPGGTGMLRTPEAPGSAFTSVPSATKPVDAPSSAASEGPSASGSAAATGSPATVQPTDSRTSAPTDSRTSAPTDSRTSAPTESRTSAPTDSGTPAPTEVLVGAADVARCDSDMDEATASLLDGIEGWVFVAGDTVYDSGTPEEYRECYAPTWGRHLERTRFVVPGDHEYETPGAAGYRSYFGAAAGSAGSTWHSGDLGAWHVVALDANCEFVGGCDEGSPQLEWLRGDLTANDASCTLAILHYPRFSSGFHGSYESMTELWRVLYDYDAEVVLSGDDHSYERFAPQDPEGEADPATGIRQFVIGTGGTFLRDMATVEPNSEVRNDDTHGVLRLELSEGAYAWSFVPIAGQTFTDSGTGTCH